jgi:hypothetical protein
VSCELHFGLLLSDMSSNKRAFACTFLTSMPDVPSKTCIAIRNDYGGACESDSVPGQRHGHL